MDIATGSDQGKDGGVHHALCERSNSLEVAAVESTYPVGEGSTAID